LGIGEIRRDFGTTGMASVLTLALPPHMAEVQLPEVFTVDEVSRATGVPRDHLYTLIAAGELQWVTGTRFISADEARRIGRRLRRSAPAVALTPSELFSATADSGRRPTIPAFASSFVHATLLGLAVLLSSMDVDTAVTEASAHEPVRLVFLVSPGPGGGGGGGGLRNPLPAPKIERKSPTPRRAVTVPTVTPRPVVTTPKRDITPPKRPTPAATPTVVPKPPQREPEPLPSNVLVAPVVTVASDTRDREGVVERGQGNANSQGSGTGGGAGTGHGTGNGEGLGSGIGDGSGGGTGGGPYRPGSGIEPPRLVREVKAEYTEEARRRSLTGDVLLEIVVRFDGTVGDVRLVRGLGSGLDQRAVQAVRQWRFDPARRKGVPVNVLVEVAVEFILR
jgi:periplasmic protein TonB